ncbi:MAG: adenine deaminase [Deltaproteobacteria bacterium]|nr:adenine deaminase [Deltaproteobacteria bacterium]
MEHLIDVAKGDRPPDLLLRGARIVNVFTGEIYPTNIAIAGEWIAGVGEDYTEGREVLDLEGLFLAPGLINGHLHLESSLLSPGEYARLALPRGTTTVVLDPHEIANVLGVSGIHALIDASRDLPLDFFFMAPSCVPATHLETAGASLSAKEIGKLLSEPGGLGLGEMMNFPGVLQKDPEVLRKIQTARKTQKPVDGHAPLLSGRSLNAYLASGIESDHESTRQEEAQEKLRLGMWLMIREGSAARNLKDLLPAVTPQNSRRCLFVLDDLEPADLLKRGEMDHLLRESTSRGLNPITAIQMATLNPAERFGFKDRGAIAPGRRADIIGLADLKEFRPRLVIKNGRVAAREGKAYPFRVKDWDERTLRTVRIKPLNDFSFDLPLRGEKAWAIGLVPDQILTRKLAVLVGKDTRGLVRSDPESDILKIAVVERHRASGRIGLGLVKGLGLKMGAVATSVAHDSHNVIVAGADDSDMKTAVQEIEKMQGGFVVVEEGKVLAGLPLPVAGLMSPQPAEAVAAGMESLNQAAREIGATLQNPFIALSFLALPVIPELRITDRGLVDVSEFRIIPPEA